MKVFKDQSQKEDTREGTGRLARLGDQLKCKEEEKALESSQ